ncbi:MAG TPA: hypothetical protein PKI03_16065 [Pseudomonadota bacterium]|nr:hypothetical protein [Pseudomonadota bacterium]
MPSLPPQAPQDSPPRAAGSPPAIGPATPQVLAPGDCIYVDGVEAGIARLLIAHPNANASGLGDDWREYRMPVHVLPQDVREGDWLTLNLKRVPAPSELENKARSLRDELGANDDGGDFSL